MGLCAKLLFPLYRLLIKYRNKIFNQTLFPQRVAIMVSALLELFHVKKFIGPGKPPKRWDKPAQKSQSLFSREFILLFLLAMCSNSFIAVYYCFEQWMQSIHIVAHWRGILLSALFAMILVFRPVTSIIMLKHGKFWPMSLTLAICILVMMAYPYVTPTNAVPMILGLRLIQGIALAVFSACTIGVLVECIPPGQSARGFAIFSLTMLLPYSIIPALSEEMLPMLGSEATLFALTAWLGLPGFVMILLMRKRLQVPEAAVMGGGGLTLRQLVHAILHSGLGFVYLSCLSFSMTTIMAIFFMKGICLDTGAKTAWFFSSYSITIIIVRIFASRMMDTLPRYRVTVFCALVLSACMLAFTAAPVWTFIPVSCVYGLSLGLLYPLLAAAVYDRSTPATRSVNSNVMMATFDASGMLAPMLGGAVISAGFSYHGVFITAAMTAVACGIFMLCDRAIQAHHKKTANAI